MEGNNKWFGGVLVGIVLTSLIAIGMSKMKGDPKQDLIPKNIIDAYNQGLKDALRLNPVSWDLEQACLTIWANKQPIQENFK
jgi:hypothetical protein